MIKKKRQEKQETRKVYKKTKLPGPHLLGPELVANCVIEKKERKYRKRKKEKENKTKTNKKGKQTNWLSSSATGACSIPCKRKERRRKK